VTVCSQLPDNDNASVTTMAEYLAAEVIKEHDLHTPLVWLEHYPEHEEEIGEYSLQRPSTSTRYAFSRRNWQPSRRNIRSCLNIRCDRVRHPSFTYGGLR
jgi:hypothetical protein